MSIFQITNALAFMLPIGFSVAALTRCSNELGAGRARRAKFASDVAFTMILVVEAAVSVAILLVKDVWGSLYTADERVVSTVSKLLVPLAVYTAFDGALCVASCTPRGRRVQCNHVREAARVPPGRAPLREQGD